MAQNKKQQESIREILESNSYKMQVRLINNEINRNQQVNGYATPRFASPNFIFIDREVFKKTQEEKDRCKEYRLELGKAKKMKTLVKAAY
jgi:hypothetical protein